MTVFENFQNFGVSRNAGFCFRLGIFHRRQFEFVEKNLRQLFRRIDVETFAGESVNIFFDFVNANFHSRRFFVQTFFIDDHAAHFHFRQNFRKRQFNFAIKFRQTGCVQFFCVEVAEFFESKNFSGKRIRRNFFAFKFDGEKFGDGIFFALRVEKVSGKLNVEKIRGVRNFRVVKNFFQIANDDFIFVFPENFFELTFVCRESFAVRNFHRAGSYFPGQIKFDGNGHEICTENFFV